MYILLSHPISNRYHCIRPPNSAHHTGSVSPIKLKQIYCSFLRANAALATESPAGTGYHVGRLGLPRGAGAGAEIVAAVAGRTGQGGRGR